MNIIHQDFNQIEANSKRAFNPAIFEWQGKTWLCYRFEPYAAYPTELALVELDETLQPIEGTRVPLNISRVGGSVCTLDDPRIIMYKGSPYILHAQGRLNPDSSWSNCQVFTRIEKNFCCNWVFYPKVERNVNNTNTGHIQACEKNWTPFIHNGSVHFVYKFDPFIVYKINNFEADATCELVHTGDQKLRDFYEEGMPSGGSQGLKYGNGWLVAFHSHTPNKYYIRDYYMGLLYFEQEGTGFTIKKITPKPILKADWKPKEDCRNASAGWVPNAIFPCGILERKNDFFISYGWQDQKSKILVLTKEEIEKELQDVEVCRELPKDKVKCLPEEKSKVKGKKVAVPIETEQDSENDSTHIKP